MTESSADEARQRYEQALNQPGLSDELLRALTGRLGELQKMSSDPSAVAENIKAVEACLQRRSLSSATDNVIKRLAVTRAFQSTGKDSSAQ
eukprot:SAG31_NODE_2036_length_6607_cov_5.713430_2_plen_91_part_00